MSREDTHGTGRAVDLSAGTGSGPLWGMASADLNATLLAWPAGHEIAEHVNAELDVLLVVVAGSATVTIDDDTPHDLRAPAALLVPRGARRAIRAGAEGTRYLSVHRAPRAAADHAGRGLSPAAGRGVRHPFRYIRGQRAPRPPIGTGAARPQACLWW